MRMIGTILFASLMVIFLTTAVGAETCCQGRTGDANNMGGDDPTIGDVGALVNALFLAGNCDGIACMTEADVNQSGGLNPTCEDITISDLGYLIEYLFIWMPCDPFPCEDDFDLPDCLPDPGE